MKNRFRYSTLLSFLLLAGTVFGQESKPQQIVWGTKEITWDDFKGPYNRKSSGIASTYSYMDMDIFKEEGRSIVKLRAVFDMEESWVVYKDKSVLNHERGHFNITELYARKLRKKIAETTFSRENYKHELWALYKEYDDLMDKYQDLYDDDTDSSMDTPKQKAWEAQLKKELEEMDAYKNPEMVIRFKENK